MYSIFIADDESIIREGIKYLLDYEALGYRICGEAASGDQALERILALRPDVSLMDIRMPGISGLDAVRAAREQGYTGKVVIVSSYTDFKYAQEAIRYGVQHYITKPIDEDELAAILKEFAADFEKEAQDRSTRVQYRSKVRDAVVADILQGERLPAREHLEALGLAADAYQAIILARPDVDPNNAKLLHTDNVLYDHVVLDGQEVLLLKGSAAIRRFHELLDFDLHSHRSGHFPYFFACGTVVDDVTSVVTSYQQAAALAARRFFCAPGQSVLTAQDLPSVEGSKVPVDSEQAKKYADLLLNCIQSFNRRKMAETLKQLQDMLSNCDLPIRSIRLFLTDLHLQVREQLNQIYTGGEIAFYSNSEIIHTIEKASYLHEIIQFLSQRFEMFMDATGTSTRDSILDDILHYIHHNYSSNITLETMAPLFGYNRSYLGKIFTKKMGQNFNSYVDHVRIEKSKELLLSDNAKVYHIAERVGYRNVDYFHIKFRKYVGMSPAEYRKLNKPSSPHGEKTEKGTLL